MIGITLFLLCQTSGDTLRWYDTTTAGYTGMAPGAASEFHWAIIFPIDSSLDGRTVHSGRVMIWEPMDSSGTMRLCLGGYDGSGSNGPDVILDSGSFHATDPLAFYEILFGDTIVLHDGDTIWLWCSQLHKTGQRVGTTDSGPAVRPWGDLFSFSGVVWYENYDFGLDCNWVMELILTPLDVEEGPAKPEELFLITSFTKSEIKITYAIPQEDAGYVSLKAYDIAGREVKNFLGRETGPGWYEAQWKPLASGVYFLVLRTPTNTLTARVVTARR
jgi:hypothetical protein